MHLDFRGIEQAERVKKNFKNYASYNNLKVVHDKIHNLNSAFGLAQFAHLNVFKPHAKKCFVNKFLQAVGNKFEDVSPLFIFAALCIPFHCVFTKGQNFVTCHDAHRVLKATLNLTSPIHYVSSHQKMFITRSLRHPGGGPLKFCPKSCLLWELRGAAKRIINFQALYGSNSMAFRAINTRISDLYLRVDFCCSGPKKPPRCVGNIRNKCAQCRKTNNLASY